MSLRFKSFAVSVPVCLTFRFRAKLEALAAELRASGGPTPESVKEFSRIYQKYGGGSANPPPTAAVVEQKEACVVM